MILKARFKPDSELNNIDFPDEKEVDVIHVKNRLSIDEENKLQSSMFINDVFKSINSPDLILAISGFGKINFDLVEYNDYIVFADVGRSRKITTFNKRAFDDNFDVIDS